MTHCQQLTSRTRFPFEAFTHSRCKTVRKKASKKRTIKRVAHFLGFLLYWAVVLSVAEIATVCVMLAFVFLN